MQHLLTEHPALVLFQELLVPSPSGREERLAAVVRGKLDEMGYAHATDPAGNVMVRLPGRNPDLPLAVFASHMDEIGAVVTRVEADGTLSLAASGGLVPQKIGECAVDIVGDGEVLTGVLSFGSWHSRDAGNSAVTWDAVRVLTGLSSEQLANAGVRVGSTIVPQRAARGPVVFGDPAAPLVGAWTFDDRMGIVALLRLLKAIREQNIVPIRPTMIAFTVHEEGGCHGAKVLAHRERPEVFIAVDGCPMPPGSGLVLDDRPVTWSKDFKAHLDQGLVRDFHRAAREAGTGLQTVVLGQNAYSDASAVYDSGAAPRVGIIGHVRENSHGFEVSRVAVFDNVLKLLVKFMETWS